MRFKSEGIGVTDSMPERIQITQQIQLRLKQQAEADAKAKSERVPQSTAQR